MDRDNDVYRIIGQLEANIQSIFANDKDCRQRRESEYDKLIKTIDIFKSEMYVKFNDKYNLVDGKQLESEVDKINNVLNLDNSEAVKRNVGTMNGFLNSSGFFVGALASVLGFVYLIARLIHV